MADACCINAYDLCWSYIWILKTLKSEDIWQDVCFDIPDVDNREPQYIIYTDKCWCQCCLDGEKEIIINTFPWEVKTITLTPSWTCIWLKWSEIYWWNWCKTMVRYKIWSYPTDLTDWTLAIEETQQNQYCSSAYTITWLTKGCTYYLKAFWIDNDWEIINSNCCNVYLPTFTTCCFWYTWAQQSITLDPWTYKLEVWWAQGWTWNNSYPACWCWWKWWYSSGCITLTSTTTVYVYVWWQGCFCTTTSAIVAGWWNWWGNWSNYNSEYVAAWWGWGTDIRIWWNTLYYRRIVAWWWWGGGCYCWAPTCLLCWWAWWGINWCPWAVYSGYSSSGWSQTSWWASGCCWYTVWTFWQWGSKTSWNNWYNWGWWWWGWYGWWAWWAVSTWWWGWSWYVYNSSTCWYAPSWYYHNTSYFLTGAYTCCWLNSFPTAAWWTEVGHSWHGCAKISAV